MIGKSVVKVQSNGDTTSGKAVGPGLGLNAGENFFYILKEHNSGLEYIRNGRELCEQGLFVRLQGYQYQLFLEFTEIFDASGEYKQLSQWLNGGGVPRIDQALTDMKFAPVNSAFRSLMNEETLKEIAAYWFGSPKKRTDHRTVPPAIVKKYCTFIQDVARFEGTPVTAEGCAEEIATDLLAVKRLTTAGGEIEAVLKRVPGSNRSTAGDRSVNFLLAWIVCRKLARPMSGLATDSGRPDILNRLPIASVFEHVRDTRLIDALISYQHLFSDIILHNALEPMTVLLDDVHVQSFIGVNTYKDIIYYSKEQFEELVDWLLIAGGFTVALKQECSEEEQMKILTQMGEVAQHLKRLAERSGYRFHDFRKELVARPAPLRHKEPAH